MCERNKIKSFLFGIMVSGVFVSAIAADDEIVDYSFYPLNFSYITKTDSAAQKAEWDYLMKFKIFGRTGIDFGGTNINIPDKVGWFGTAQGDWTMKNEKHRVGGPIVIGGNVSFEDGQDSILTGPMRVKGGVKVGNFNPVNSVVGSICVSGSVDPKFEDLVASGNKYFYGNYGNCPSTGPDSVPQVRENLAIPVVSDDEIPAIRDDQSLVFKRDGNHTQVANGMIYVDDTTGYIDVPKSKKETEEERDIDAYDLHVSEMHLKNKNHLIVRMPEGGRLTRVFIDGAFEVQAHSHIQIEYMADDALYDEPSHRWSDNSKSSAIQNDKYMGNLLFYAKGDMIWDALTPTDSIQGTFISQRTIQVKQQMTLAGQLIANKIVIDANFDGSGFIFKPFNPAKIDPKALAEGMYRENDSLVAINIVLDKVPTTDVKFKYYFKYDNSSTSGKASAADFKLDVEGEFLPMSKDTKDSVRIFAGEKAPTDSANKAWIRIAKDELYEGTETFQICISELSGAIIKGNYDAEGRNVCLPLYILDANNYPPVFKDNDKLIVSENVLGDIAGTIVASDADKDPLTYSIVGGSGKDIFVINQEGVLSLKPDVSVDYEQNASFTVQVGVTDHRVTDLVKKTYTVKVRDVNENPIAEDGSYKIKENSSAGKVVCYYEWDDLDKASAFTKHNIAVAVEGPGSDTDLFEISKDGTVTVKEGAVLDYETQTVHHLKIKVVDSTDVSLYDEATITINLLDEDDGPVIIIVPGDDPRNDPESHVLVLKNGDKHGTEENNEAGVLAGKVEASCSAIKCEESLTYTMFEDKSGLFGLFINMCGWLRHPFLLTFA